MAPQISRRLEGLKQLLIFLFDWRSEDDREDDALWACPTFTALSGRQIKAILAIVKREIRQTKKQYGHTIRKEDARKEKYFFLLVFQNMGGIFLLSERTSFESVQHRIYAEMEAGFEEEIKHYFDEWNGKGSRAWYRCHLQNVSGVLLNAIWSGEITQV